MSARPWYKHYPSDFLKGVVGIQPEVIGCYIVVLDLIYDHGEPIENDHRYVAAILGCSPRKARSLIDRLIAIGKLFLACGKLTNMRVEKEIAVAQKMHRKLVESGSNGGRQRVENERGRRNINGLGQATLKHRARVQIPDRYNLTKGSALSQPTSGQAEKAPEQAAPSAPEPQPSRPLTAAEELKAKLVVSPALLGTQIMRATRQ